MLEFFFDDQLVPWPRIPAKLGLRYPTNLPAPEGDLIASCCPQPAGPGRPRKPAAREWRKLPQARPPWRRGSDDFRPWARTELLPAIHAQLRAHLRLVEGRPRQPTAGIVTRGILGGPWAKRIIADGFHAQARNALRHLPENSDLAKRWVLLHIRRVKLTIANTAWFCILLGRASDTTGWAADWPMFRGQPALTGIAVGQLPEKPVLLWTFKTGGPVKSSAAVVGNRVFVGSDDRNLYALDLATGKKIWAFTNSDAIESSPLVLDGKVFVGSSDANLYALDAATGKQIWKYTTGDKILGAPNWFVSGGQTNVLIGSYDFKLHCLTAATGKSNWVYESANYINGSPAVADGQTVFGGCDGLLYVISLADGSQSRSNEIGAPIAASVALADGRAYFGHYENQFLCADLKLGSNVWAFHDRQFPYFSSPAVTKDRVVFGGRDKMLHCVNRADGQSVWSFATRGRVDSSPVVCGDKVVVGSDDGRLYLVGLNDGKEIWSYEIGQPVGSSPAVADGKIVIGNDDGSVCCFGAKVEKK